MKTPAKEAPRRQTSLLTQVLLPLAAVIRGDLLALVHQLGMQAIAAMLEAEEFPSEFRPTLKPSARS